MPRWRQTTPSLPAQRGRRMGRTATDRNSKRYFHAATLAVRPQCSSPVALLRTPLHAPLARCGSLPQRLAARHRAAKRSLDMPVGWGRLKLKGFPGRRPWEGRFGSGVGKLRGGFQRDFKLRGVRRPWSGRQSCKSYKVKVLCRQLPGSDG